MQETLSQKLINAANYSVSADHFPLLSTHIVFLCYFYFS